LLVTERFAVELADLKHHRAGAEIQRDDEKPGHHNCSSFSTHRYPTPRTVLSRCRSGPSLRRICTTCALIVLESDTTSRSQTSSRKYEGLSTRPSAPISAANTSNCNFVNATNCPLTCTVRRSGP